MDSNRPFSLAAAMSAVMMTLACAQVPEPAAPAQSAVERGRTLVTIGGCSDCHTPKKMGPRGPEPDTSRLLSGHPEDVPVTAPYEPAPGTPWIAATNAMQTAWSGPWGVSFSANLTPDANTGLRSGVWSEEAFIKALRTGKHVGVARDILPPMPWQDIGKLNDDDLRAIWAFLGTVPAVNNHVPEPLPPASAPAQ